MRFREWFALSHLVPEGFTLYLWTVVHKMTSGEMQPSSHKLSPPVWGCGAFPGIKASLKCLVMVKASNYHRRAHLPTYPPFWAKPWYPEKINIHHLFKLCIFLFLLKQLFYSSNFFCFFIGREFLLLLQSYICKWDRIHNSFRQTENHKLRQASMQSIGTYFQWSQSCRLNKCIVTPSCR